MEEIQSLIGRQNCRRGYRGWDGGLYVLEGRWGVITVCHQEPGACQLHPQLGNPRLT